MQDYDDNKAIKAMSAVLEEGRRNEDAIYEVLDLIFDYYEENGEFDIDFSEEEDFDGDDNGVDTAAMVDFIAKYLKKHPAEVAFTKDEILKMVEAELAYEETLI